MKNEKGLELLDVLIIILIGAVIAAIMVPKIKGEKKKKIMDRCRTQIRALSEAEFRYYKDAWRSSLPSPDSLAKLDSLATAAKKARKKVSFTLPDTINVVRVFTDDINKLKEYLPSWAETLAIDGKCPLDGKNYIFVVRDSLFFSITCPNGHGESVKGILSWEKK